MNNAKARRQRDRNRAFQMRLSAYLTRAVEEHCNEINAQILGVFAVPLGELNKGNAPNAATVQHDVR